VLGAVLGVSRIGYWAAGVRFDAGFPDRAMQMLDPDVLAAHPFTSAWYLHIQPPLFNLAAGLVFRLAGDRAGLAFHVLYLGLTVALALHLRPLLRDLGMGPRWATGLTAAVVVSPTIVQFEHLLFYPHVETTLLVVAVRSLQRWAGDRVAHRWSLVGFAAALTALALGRSVYHPLWFALLAGVLALAARRLAPATPRPGRESRPRRSGRWALVAAAVVPLVAGTAVGVKNLALYGWFTTSSLEGANLLRMVDDLTDAEADSLLASGTITEASRAPFLCLGSDREFPAVGPDAHHPALDRYRRRSDPALSNLNHRSMVPCLRRLRTESLAVIREAPRIYLRHVGTSFLVVGYAPTPDIRVRPANQAALAGPARVEAFLLGSVGERLNDVDADTFRFQPAHIEWVVVVVGAGSLVGLAAVVARGGGRRRERERGRGQGRPATRPAADVVVAGFLLSTLVLSMVLCQFVESGENSRFRSTTDPLLLPAVALLTRPLRHRPDRPMTRRPEGGDYSRPRPVTRGRSRAVNRPGGDSTTAGTALTRRMAVALRPAVLWSPSVPSIWRSRVYMGSPVTTTR